jgi:alkaline phosphatase D
MDFNQRRRFFKKLGLSIFSLSLPITGFPSLLKFSLNSPEPSVNPSPDFADDFARTNDRVWIGEKYWAIPMEDWRVKGGRIECVGLQPNSRVNLLTTLIKAGAGEINISAEIGLLASASGKAQNGSAGFSIGITDPVDSDIKSLCYYGKGLPAGISNKGNIFIADVSKPLPADFDFTSFNLTLQGSRANNQTQIKLIAKSKSGKPSEVIFKTAEDILGLVALVNNFEERGGANFWFRQINLTGSKTENKDENAFGPVLWSMHTLSKGILNIMAQMPPLGDQDNQEVELHLQKNNAWAKTANQKIDKEARTAHFQIKNWASQTAVPYKIIYKNNGQEFEYAGNIRPEPLNRSLKFGGLTCQEWGGYPYSPLVKNLEKHNPDMLYFSGDQLYEGNGGYPIKREPEPTAILSYLGKWYMFGWAFGHLMRDRPTICTPDDHDIFQGNLWGEEGKTVPLDQWEKIKDAHGGYVQTARMVNVVGKTQCGHLPDFQQAKTLASGIKTWYSDLTYGQVSFAIISDRMFKSGPEMVRSGEGRLDHIKEPLAKNALEKPHLKLVGDTQMQFLKNWIEDWEGASLKVMLSQTLFCNVGTHHGNDKMFLYGDMDSGGWPKQNRDEVLKLIRKACAFHINGDQHLPFLVQYSLDEARDGGWTFCTPAISTGYIRWGQPDSVNAPHTARPAHGLPNTGLYQDIFGNLNYIYAVGNPLDNYQNKNRYLRAQNKSSGFGLITFDTDNQTIKMEAFRFLADKDKPTSQDQFPGWPLTIKQTDNDGRKPTAYLPKLEINKPNQVIKIVHEQNQDLINILRIKGTTYQPVVFEAGSYTIVVGEGNNTRELKGIKATTKMPKKSLKVQV